jgi:adenine/guanine phosphoribosyltransferase-like PRPP-binding protein
MVVDDVLATGGTLQALNELLQSEFGVSGVVMSVVLEIGVLGGRSRLERGGVTVRSLICS